MQDIPHQHKEREFPPRERTRSKSKYSFEEECSWLFEQLASGGQVTRKAFNTRFELGERLDKWSIACDALLGVLPKLDDPMKVKKRKDESDESGGEVLYLETSEGGRYCTKLFNPSEDRFAKRQIGALVALHLRTLGHDKPGFLGSGSTVFHVGMQMREIAKLLGAYEQEFSTINIAIAADWCERAPHPVDEVSILEGTLKTQSFRYDDMEEPSWFAPIVVISADGVHLDERSGASLIAKSAAVAKLSHQVIERAANSVVCCLASRKLQHRTGLEASGGAIIKPPSAAKVRRFLVSEGEVKSPIIPALEKAGWEIITNLFKWPTMKEHVQQWKEQKKWQGIADYLNSLGLATVEQSEDLKDPK